MHPQHCGVIQFSMLYKQERMDDMLNATDIISKHGKITGHG